MTKHRPVRFEISQLPGPGDQLTPRQEMLFYLLCWYAAHNKPLPLYRELGRAMGMTKNGVCISIWTFKQLGLLETKIARPHHQKAPGVRAIIAALE